MRTLKNIDVLNMEKFAVDGSEKVEAERIAQSATRLINKMGNVLSDYQINGVLENVTIEPNHLAADLQQLISRGNLKENPILQNAIKLIEEKKLVLFDPTTYTKYEVLPSILFLPNPGKQILLYNVSKVGSWGKTSYDLTSGDLKYALTAGAVAYNAFINGGLNNYLQNIKLISSAVKIYAKMFEAVLGKIGIILDQEQRENVRYTTAKFYLIHSLEYDATQASKIASKAILQHTSSATEYLLKDFEEVNEIKYNSLIDYIASIGNAFIKRPIKISEIYNGWITNYGASTQFALEYFPYLLMCIIGMFHNSIVTKIIGKRKTEYLKDIILIIREIDGMF